MKLKPIVAVMPVMFAMLTGCNTMDWSSYHSEFPFFSGHHYHYQHDNTPGDIIENAIKSNESEIKLAHLAKKKSTCPRLKHYAAILIKDHSQNLRAVRRLSRETGIAPTVNSNTARIEEKGEHKYAELKQLHGHQFDQEFLESMIHCHHKALAKLDREIIESTHPKLTAYLRATHAMITKHLHEAEAIQRKWAQQ